MKGLETDLELVERASTGDRLAFESLVARYQGPVYNAALRVTGNPADAHDVAQTVFLKVVEHLHEYDRQRKFFSWIFRIAVNEAINLVQRRRPEDPLDDDDDAGHDAGDGSRPDWRYGQHQIADRIQQALMTLRTDDRIVLTLRHFSECSYQEMAQILSLEVKTVKSRLYEARQRLGDMLLDLKVR